KDFDRYSTVFRELQQQNRNLIQENNYHQFEQRFLENLITDYQQECAKAISRCVVCYENKFFYSDLLICPQCKHVVCKECVKNGRLEKCPLCKREIPPGEWETIPLQKIPKLIRDEASSQLNQDDIIDVRLDSVDSKMNPYTLTTQVTVEKIKKMIDFPDLGRQHLASEAAEETAVTAAGLTAAEGAEVEVA
ncbi:hypothetical protein N9E76_00205, partial [bacterium]|nr:hypothetical protein [bacterium]